MNKVKASKENKKVFNDLNKLIIHINNNKVKKEDAVERLNKSISDLDQLKQKQSTAFQNKLIHVVYQLFNSFGFNKEFKPLFYQIKSEQIEEEPVKSKVESLSERSKSDTKEPAQLKKIDVNEITKPLWIKLSRSNLTSLVKDVEDVELTEWENEIPDISNLATKTALTAAENKISDVSSLVKKRDFDTEIAEVENKLNNHNHDK